MSLNAVYLLTLALFIAFAWSRTGRGMLWRCERLLSGIGRRPFYSLMLVGLVGVLSAAGVSALIGIPRPSVHDEFSYLLAADTFAHGRLTSPTHPMWVHFETFHVLQQPTYQSKYPPGQGLALALGQRLIGLPIAGLWLTHGLLCAALCWMLRAWMPPKWALLGGLLATINLTLLEWCSSYWGGTVAALGGALALGGYCHLTRFPGVSGALLMGTGIGVLALSRLYEGFILSLLLLLAAAHAVIRLPKDQRAPWLRAIALPMAAMPLVALLFIAIYNRSVTGSPFRLPYQVYEAQYAVAPSFLFQSRRPVPRFHHDVMRRYALTDQLDPYLRNRSGTGRWIDAKEKLRFAALGYTRPAAVMLALILLPLALISSARMRGLALIWLLFYFAMLAEKDMFLHYTAPIMAIVWMFIMQSMRYLDGLHVRSRRVGRLLSRAVMAACVLSYLKWCVDFPRLPHSYLGGERLVIDRDLRRLPGKHLIIAYYRQNHNPTLEWVYNSSDIDTSPVVWARDMGPIRNRELISYFKDRTVWLLDADLRPPRLVPYPLTQAAPLKERPENFTHRR